ncbi:MAG: MarR family winged helix-turn-helix transcriptional regulator [Actinomycetota bacterium]
MGEGKREDPDTSLEELVNRFLESMGVIMRLRNSLFRREMSRHEVTMPQFILLKMVGAHGEMTVSRAADMMMVAPPTASRMIDNLCRKGLLERRKDEDNRRITRVRLTPRGDKVLRELNQKQREALMSILGGQEDDFESLVAGLESLTSRLSEIAGRVENIIDRNVGGR